ncbi:ribonuclease HI [Enterococcus sp. JM4C]|uniref:ribonuclease HI family protein n=1 Tax=Candidatus Enterococcus huntleyi TaxID=1857217 RepID=UPI001379908C|nr:ribonuclease HI family protein [Enterococcus sp. JM4C]KAF1296051.1 ribonuclease HI [Enterococcus sp. JM4C]
MIKVFIDASTKGNPGPSGGGLMITSEEIYKQYTYAFSELTNHQAEFEILLTALHVLLEEEWQDETITIYSDSKVVVQTIDKNYTGNPLFVPYLEQFQALAEQFSLLLIQWIPEGKNKGADNLARQGLQKALKGNKKRQKNQKPK